MSAPADDPNMQLAERLKRVRDIEGRLQDQGQRETQLSKAGTVLILILCGGVFLLWSVWTGTSPIPRGKENREEAVLFLKQHFPNRGLRPAAEESSTAPVAAVFHLIRNGDAEDAKTAIDFAAEQNFGYASPYVIERLESDDPELRNAARSFLRKMAARDYGPDAAAWRDWWEDGPPRSLLGLITVDHGTFQLAIPIVSGVVGLLGLLMGALRKTNLLTAIGGALLVLGWFLLIGTAGIQWVGSFDQCRFGGDEITYHQSHGVVEGLEDAKVGGAALWLALCLAYIAVPFLLVIPYILIHSWWIALRSHPQNTAA